jgi:CTP synthase
LGRTNYLTAGAVYRQILDKERRLEYGGRCIDAYQEIPQEVLKHWETAAKGQDFFIIELGGTVGEYQNILFFEAARRLKIKYPGQVLFVHVVYLPTPGFLGEMKSKPAQASILALNALGIFADLVVCRAESPVDRRRREKIGFTAALPPERIFSAPDVNSIYQVPLLLEEQGLVRILLTLVHQKVPTINLTAWRQLIASLNSTNRKVTVGIVGKYQKSGDFSLSDSYVCVVEAIKHAAWDLRLQPVIRWFDSAILQVEDLTGVEAVIVPQGWGSRGVEGKIKAVRYAREHKIPYLGLCFGLQMAVIEFGRHVLGLKNANSTEIDFRTSHPVVHIMPDQAKYLARRQYGGTIRLGAWPCRVKKGTRLASLYGKAVVIQERHRHRYEFNNRYRRRYEKAGMVFSGLSPDNKLVEAIELLPQDHPFFIATQYHPEYLSRPLRPHPVFLGLLRAAKELR